MRAVALTSAKGGIDRTRTKGGAKPDTLYDGVNCWVTVSLSIRPRPGTNVDVTLPPGTVGLTTHAGKRVVFSDEYIDLSSFPNYRLEILTHPTDQATELVAIHFAEPFLGFLYVVAQWDDGAIFHYWLETADVWQADTAYAAGTLVAPSTPNGYYYRANRLTPAGVTWAPDVARADGDKVEPTVYNNYEYTVIETYGDNPRSGSVEPVWPTIPGATVVEDTQGNAPTTPTTPTTPTGDTTLPPAVIDRYGTGRVTGGNGRVSEA